MSQQSFDFQDLLQLVELMKSTSQFSEFKLKANGIELELRRGPGGSAVAASAPVLPAPASVPAVAAAAPALPAAPETRPADASSPRRDAASARPDAVKAPMVGTVYLAPEPGAQPFVVVGQAVEADTQICIVEVMKLMNSVLAGRRGVVSEILVEDGEAVEYAQPLFVITPG